MRWDILGAAMAGAAVGISGSALVTGQYQIADAGWLLLLGSWVCGWLNDRGGPGGGGRPAPVELFRPASAWRGSR